MATQADIDALEAAINSGATLVRFGSGADSREVRYRSLGDMQKVLSDLKAEVAGTAPQSMRTVGGFCSGLSEPSYPFGDCWNRR